MSGEKFLAALLISNVLVDRPDLLDEIRWNSLDRRFKEHQISLALALFRHHGIEPILIKGWAVGYYYPSYKYRSYNDIDLAVPDQDFPNAQELATDPSVRSVYIDVHRGLRHLDTLPWTDLFANSRLVPLNEIDIRVLGPEDQLRVTCVHWLTDGGAYKERLWDIYYSVQNRPADFDWSRCLGVVSSTRRKWIISAIGIAHRHLGLHIDDLPFAEEAKRLPDWVERCLQKEWKSNVPWDPVMIFLKQPRKLAAQIGKRLPPNPIRATIEMEGKFDEGSRIPYQFRCLWNMIWAKKKVLLKVPQAFIGKAK